MFHVSFVKSNYKRLTRGKTNNMHFEVTGIVTRKKPEQVSEIHEKGYVPCSHFSNFHTHIHTHTHAHTHTHTHTHTEDSEDFNPPAGKPLSFVPYFKSIFLFVHQLVNHIYYFFWSAYPLINL